MSGERITSNMRDSDGRYKKGYKIEVDTRDHSYLMQLNENKSLKANSLYYGLYNLSYTDKEISNILNMSKSGISSWRIRRGLQPNTGIDESQKSDGTFKRKTIKGTRNIYIETRDRLSKWKYNIMSMDKFKCQICGNKHNLEVHHNKETFLGIMRKFLPNRDIEKELVWEEKKELARKIVDYHYDNNVSGITLCGKCHIKVHKEENYNVR